jgi:hypothetical protein
MIRNDLAKSLAIWHFTISYSIAPVPEVTGAVTSQKLLQHRLFGLFPWTIAAKAILITLELQFSYPFGQIRSLVLGRKTNSFSRAYVPD